MRRLTKPFLILFRQLNMFMNHELSDTGITSTELLYLALLYDGDGRTQDEFSSEYFVDKAATARTLKHMESKGLIVRKIDETDRRAKRVYLTRKAWIYKDKLIELKDKWEKNLGKGLDEKDLGQFETVLHQMVDNAVGMTYKAGYPQEEERPLPESLIYQVEISENAASARQ